MTYKVMPEGLEVDLAKLKTTLKGSLSKDYKLQSIDERPVAFGLRALVVKVVVEDAEGTLDRVEEIINGTPGVQSAQMEEMGRLF